MISSEECLIIVANLIKNSYPNLRNKRIRIIVKKLRRGSMRASGAITKRFRITIDPIKYQDTNRMQLKGALAHELIHFEDYSKRGIVKSLIIWFRYHFDKKFVINYERSTDRRTIERGYARELYANRNFRLRGLSKKEKSFSKSYLSPVEIKSYAKSIRK